MTYLIRIKDSINSKTTSRLFSSIGWSLIGEILSKGLLFLSWLIVARVLGKVGYGQFGIIRSTITMFAIFGGLGLGLTANKFVSEHRNSNKLLVGQIIGMSQLFALISGLILASLILIFSQDIAIKMLKSPILENELRISAIMLFFTAINGAQIGILQGLESYRKLAILNSVTGITSLPLFAIGTYFYGLSGSIIAFATNIIISTVLFQFAIQKELKSKGLEVSYSNIGDSLPVFFNFSLPAALTGIAVSPFKWYSEIMLVKCRGFEDLGIFQAAFVMTSIFVAIASTINAPLISIASNNKSDKQEKKLQYITLYSSWYFFLLISIPLLLFPKTIIILFGNEFNDANLFKTSMLMMLWCGMLLYYQGITRLVILKSSLWFLLITNLFEGLTLLIAFYFLKRYGAVGLGLSYVLSYVIRIVVTVPYFYFKNLLPREILFDKYFLISIVLFVTAMYTLIWV